MGLQIVQKTGMAKIKAVADVVFCFDCTGSMGGCIENVKEYANAFAQGLASGKNPVDWRMRATGYGDLEEGEEMQNSNDFVNTIPEFQAQLEGIQMCFGGDAPESSLDAIIVAAKTSKWRKAHKIIVLFTDAPTKDLHPSTRKKFAINNIKELIETLSKDHIKLFLWGPSDPMFNELKIVPKAEITELADPHSDYESENKMEKLLELMGKTVSDTIGSETL